MMTFDNQSAANQTALNRNKRQAWLMPELVMKMMKWLTTAMGLNSTLLGAGTSMMDSFNATSMTNQTEPSEVYDDYEAIENPKSDSDLDLYIVISMFGLVVLGVSVGIWMIIYAEIRDTRANPRCQPKENCPHLRRRNPSTSTKNSEISAITSDEIPSLETPIKLWRP